MRVFVTGASGFIGSAVVKELIAAGHQVLGLARSDASAHAVAAAGAEVLRGDLDQLDVLKRGARESDGVIHTAFVHDFSDWHRSIETDRVAIEAFGEALEGTNKPFIAAAGCVGIAPPGGIATEDQPLDPTFFRKSEPAALALAGRGVRAMALRLPPTVHGEGDHGFVATLIAIARDKGVSAYIGDGTNRWSAVHRLDAARAFRLALEKGRAGARYQAIADQGVPTREIADVIGANLHLPVTSISADEAPAHFTWLALFYGMDGAASSAQTRKELGWEPTHEALIPDMERHYFHNVVEHR